MTNEDRRHFSRILFDTPARLLIGGDALPVHVHDLSLKGAMIRFASQPGWANGTSCTLELILNEGETLIRMDMEVAYRQQDCIGLVCREIDLDSMIHLRRLVELNLGDETLLDRDLAALSRPQ